MKNLKKLSASFIITMAFAGLVSAQDCSLYLPGTEGATLVYSSFDKKDKLQSENTMTVVKISSITKGTQYDVESVITTPKDDKKTIMNYAMQCVGDKFLIDMKQFVAPGTVASWQDVKVQANNLAYPKFMEAGQALPGGNIVVDMAQPGAPMGMKITVDIINRKVVGKETITTPAGTFECYKITFDVNMKMMVKVATKGAEWIAPDLGVVRSEGYDNSGKLASYTVLKSVKQ